MLPLSGNTAAALTILATASIRSFFGPCLGAFPVPQALYWPAHEGVLSAIRGEREITVIQAGCGHGACDAHFGAQLPMLDHCKCWSIPSRSLDGHCCYSNCDLPRCSPCSNVSCDLAEVLLVLIVSGRFCIFWWWHVLDSVPVQRQQGQHGLC